MTTDIFHQHLNDEAPPSETAGSVKTTYSRNGAGCSLPLCLNYDAWCTMEAIGYYRPSPCMSLSPT